MCGNVNMCGFAENEKQRKKSKIKRKKCEKRLAFHAKRQGSKGRKPVY